MSENFSEGEVQKRQKIFWEQNALIQKNEISVENLEFFLDIFVLKSWDFLTFSYC